MFLSFIFNYTGVVFFLNTSQDDLSFTVKPLCLGLTIIRGKKIDLCLFNIDFSQSKRHRDLFCVRDKQKSFSNIVKT